jgi:hypothetical protein
MEVHGAALLNQSVPTSNRMVMRMAPVPDKELSRSPTKRQAA